MVLELEANQVQVHRILQSRAFRTSELHRSLLTYLAEKSLSGAADSLKEYTVGLDVFSKPASFDPRQESMVRMHVARLRQKLAEYYRTEGADDPIIVDVPKGGFRVIFENRTPSEPLTPSNTAAPSEPVEKTYRKEVLWGAGLLVLLAAGCALFFAVRFFQLAKGHDPGSPAAFAMTPELQQLWSPLLTSSRPLMVCLETQQLVTGVGTANGAFRLGQFLASHGDNVVLTRSSALSMPEIAMDNIVFLGPTNGTRQIQALPGNQQLVLEAEGIRNLSPRPGEPRFISDHASLGAQDLEESHALVSLIPGLNGEGEILSLSGNHVSSVMAAVQAFTDPGLARTLVSKMKTPGGSLPRYYQVVLSVKSMDEMPVEITYMFHRELSPAPAR